MIFARLFLITVVALFVLGLIVEVETFCFHECVRMGHSGLYCTLQALK